MILKNDDKSFDPKRKHLRTDNVKDIEACYHRSFYQVLNVMYQEVENRTTYNQIVLVNPAASDSIERSFQH